MTRRRFAAIALAIGLAACGDDLPNNTPDGSAPAADGGGGPFARGAAFATQRGCPGCHQSASPSDGILSGQTTPQPGTTEYGSNLTPDPDTGMDAWDAGAIVTALRSGVDVDGQELCPSMPRFPGMSDDEANAIASYLLSLPPVHHAVPASMCPPIKPPPDAGADDAADDAMISDASDEGG